MEPTAEALIEALTIVQQATALDFTGNSQEAIKMYTVSLTRLDAVQSVLSFELAEVVRRNSKEIRRKVELLRRTRWMTAQKSSFPEFTVQFVPLPIPVEDYRAPSDIVFRVFWLMRLLERSIQHGAFLTPRLYVSKNVWTQKGGEFHLTHISAKVRYLSTLCQAIEAIRSLTTLSDFGKVENCLCTFLEKMQKARETLALELGKHKSVETKIATKKSAWNIFSRKAKEWTAQESNFNAYLSWALNVLEQCQLFERWYIYFSQALSIPSVEKHKLQNILRSLQEITSHLYNGICVFLLHDMAILVERYQAKSIKSVVGLLPLEVKLEEVNVITTAETNEQTQNEQHQHESKR